MDKARDDFDPYCYTVEQQRESGDSAVVTEMIRDALKSPLPSLMGYLTNPNTGEPLYPNLARRNADLSRSAPQTAPRLIQRVDIVAQALDG